jgi:ATP-dependent helicase Lhr and Lhr-like helicase
VLYRDGLPIASVAGEFALLVALDAAQEQAAKHALSLGASLRVSELAVQAAG